MLAKNGSSLIRVGPAVRASAHMERDARVDQGVAGEFDSFELKYTLNFHQNGGIAAGYAFLRLITAQGLQADSALLS